MVAADAVSGVVHFLADHFGDEHVPILGPNVIAPFREHHVDPSAMTRHGLVETNGDNAVGVLLGVCASLALFPMGPLSTLQVALISALIAFFVALLVTNQIHKWAHAQRAPRVVRWLQSRALILSPEHHLRHHRDTRRAYCITTGWCNRLVDRRG